MINVLPGMRCEATAEPIVRQAFAKLAQQAYALQGPHAFESTERATAVHKAGHAVVATACGYLVSRVRIQRKRVGDEKTWVGRTYHDVVQYTGPASAVRDDLGSARNLAAGVLAEVMFDGGDFRLGSSLNEIVFFQCVVENIAFKTWSPFEEIALQVVAQVSGILQQHRDVVRPLAAELMRHGTLHGPALWRLLLGVKPLAEVDYLQLAKEYLGTMRP